MWSSKPVTAVYTIYFLIYIDTFHRDLLIIIIVSSDYTSTVYFIDVSQLF